MSTYYIARVGSNGSVTFVRSDAVGQDGLDYVGRIAAMHGASRRWVASRLAAGEAIATSRYGSSEWSRVSLNVPAVWLANVGVYHVS